MDNGNREPRSRQRSGRNSKKGCLLVTEKKLAPLVLNRYILVDTRFLWILNTTNLDSVVDHVETQRKDVWSESEETRSTGAESIHSGRRSIFVDTENNKPQFRHRSCQNSNKRCLIRTEKKFAPLVLNRGSNPTPL